MYRRIKIYERNFKDKNFIKNAKILNQYSFCLFVCFIAFIIYVIIFSITIILSNSFNKVYFKWIGDLADMSISIFFFTTICLNLWEERQLQNFVYDRELNDSNNNREKSGNQNTDIFKKSSNNNQENQKKDKENLPNNEEVKVKSSTSYIDNSKI